MTTKKSEPTPAAGAIIKRTSTHHQKREVFSRDKTCQKCGTIHYLNFEHVRPWALGGNTTKENLRLLCRNCNQRERIKMKL